MEWRGVARPSPSLSAYLVPSADKMMIEVDMQKMYMISANSIFFPSTTENLEPCFIEGDSAQNL